MIICDFKNIVDEIDTDLMEETFKGKPYIPKVVFEDCILSKGKLPRVERAKYFLEYVLLKGEVLLSFADALSSRSNVVLNFSPCEAHGGMNMRKLIIIYDYALHTFPLDILRSVLVRP